MHLPPPALSLLRIIPLLVFRHVFTLHGAKRGGHQGREGERERERERVQSESLLPPPLDEGYVARNGTLHSIQMEYPDG